MKGGEMVNVPEIGRALKKAGHLRLEPLCVYESGERPERGRPFGEADRCVAKGVLMCAEGQEPLLYIGQDARSGAPAGAPPHTRHPRPGCRQTRDYGALRVACAICASGAVTV